MNIRALRITLVTQALLIVWLVLPQAAIAAFINNGNGTVTDSVTGLMWDRCAQGQSGPACATGTISTMNWSAALTTAVSANSANYKGYNDWRLPNRNELESLVDITTTNPAINLTAFPGTPPVYFWSSTTYMSSTSGTRDGAWIVLFQEGDSFPVSKTGGLGGAVRLVRSGQLIDTFDAQSDFTPNAFSFTDQSGVALSSVATSNTITVSGINTAVLISIVGGAYSINAGAYTSAAGAANNGDTVTVRHTSSASLSTATDTILTIGAVFDTFTSTTLATPATATRLINLSTRGQVQTGDNVMIGGFIIGGASSKTVLIRAVGPNLANFGVPGVLANPTMQLFSGQTVIASNDNWQSASNAAAIQATGLAPANSLESAILVTLAPGPYTAIVSGVGGGTGVGIVEVFEMDNPTIPLINISTRGQVQTGDNVMIGGFIIQGTASQTVLIRAVGPNLANFGVQGVLANPTLQLFSGQTVIASNDDWQSASNAAAIQATGLAPANSLESAILITLAPGAYTAIVSGVGGATGVGIIEVFAQ